MNAFAMHDLIPNIYSTAFVMRFPPRYHTMVKVLDRIVLSDFINGGYYADSEPLALHQARNEELLNMIWARPLRTRGRNTGEGITETQIRSVLHRLLHMLNGDIRQGHFQHHCKGCCLSASQASQKLVAVLVDVFDQVSTSWPSTSTW